MLSRIRAARLSAWAQKILAHGLVVRRARQLAPIGEKDGQLIADALAVGLVENVFHALQYGGLLAPALLLGKAFKIGVFDESVEVAVDFGGIDPHADLSGMSVDGPGFLKTHRLPGITVGIHVGDVVAVTPEGYLIGVQRAGARYSGDC